jgi:hypothetical protein
LPARQLDAQPVAPDANDARVQQSRLAQLDLLVVASLELSRFGDDVLDLLTRECRRPQRESAHAIEKRLEEPLGLVETQSTFGLPFVVRHVVVFGFLVPVGRTTAAALSVPFEVALSASRPTLFAAAVTASPADITPAIPYTAPRRRTRRARSDINAAVAPTAITTSLSSRSATVFLLSQSSQFKARALPMRRPTQRRL